MLETTKTRENFKKSEDERFQFLFYINNHIICQRYININNFNEEIMRNYNLDEKQTKVKTSQISDRFGLKDLADNITGMSNCNFGSFGIIPKFLKKKTLEHLWFNYNPYDPKIEDNTKVNVDKNDNFQFEIKVDNITILKTEFSANTFPPKVKYAVNIKEIVPSIMSEITHTLSKKKYVNN